MQSIESIGAIASHEIRVGRVPRPHTGSERIDLESANAVRPLDVMAGMRAVERNLATNQHQLVSAVQHIHRTGGSLSSLTLLQLRVSEYTVTNQVLSSVVTSMNQSLRTVLNAS
ncbi:hypothetical protein [Burkholderia ubonensis]|uniref:hypothetical protein n=1 Tax=Burkholderia ubonensis TaxID=101571 RepID=UPI000AD2A5E4|nr:hypothetical protein [Burkholderia ubonensis]